MRCYSKMHLSLALRLTRTVFAFAGFCETTRDSLNDGDVPEVCVVIDPLYRFLLHVVHVVEL